MRSSLWELWKHAELQSLTDVPASAGFSPPQPLVDILMASEFGKSQQGHNVYSYAQRVLLKFEFVTTAVISSLLLYPVVNWLLKIINLIQYLLAEGLYFYDSTALGACKSIFNTTICTRVSAHVLMHNSTV